MPIILIFLFSLFLSCSVGMHKSQAESATYDRMEGAEMDDYASGISDGESPRMKSDKASGRYQGKKAKPAATRMVIYTSRLKIQVESVKNSLAELRQTASLFNGYLEKLETSQSYKKASIVFRVPVQQFEKTVEQIKTMGVVLSQSLSAEDVTDQFTDTKLRTESLQRVRKRLYTLLKRAKKPEEKVKILKEISRITTELDTLRQTLEYLKSKSSYSTIHIQFIAYESEAKAEFMPSPFPWIRSLAIKSRSSRFSGWLLDRFVLQDPRGFFNRLEEYRDFDQEFIYMTPGFTAGIRCGYVENYPLAGSTFWREALQQDMANRLFQQITYQKIKANGTYHVYDYHAGGDVIYSIAIRVRKKNIYIVEGYFKDEASYNKHNKAYYDFIKTLELKNESYYSLLHSMFQ